MKTCQKCNTNSLIYYVHNGSVYCLTCYRKSTEKKCSNCGKKMQGKVCEHCRQLQAQM